MTWRRDHFSVTEEIIVAGWAEQPSTLAACGSMTSRELLTSRLAFDQRNDSHPVLDSFLTGGRSGRSVALDTPSDLRFCGR